MDHAQQDVKYKAQLATQEFERITGSAYSKRFALLVRFFTSSLLLNIVETENLVLHHKYAKNALLNKDPKKDIFMK